MDFPSPFTGAVHNHRHSGECRIPEGKGNGKAPAYPPPHRQRHSRTSSTSFPHIINAIPHIINAIPHIINAIPHIINAIPHIINVIPALRQRPFPQIINAIPRIVNVIPADAGTQRKQTTPLSIIARENRLFLCVPGYPRPRV